MKVKETYRICEVSEGIFELSHGDLSLARFSRQSFREVLEKTAVEWNFSSHWIGSMLKIFQKTYPPPAPSRIRTDFDRFVYKLGPEGVFELLRSKGFRVVVKTPFSDLDLIRYAEKCGAEVEGFVGDVHYASR